MKKNVVIVVVLVVLVALAWFVHTQMKKGDAEADQATQQTVIGVIAPLSGEGAVYGEPIRRATEIAFTHSGLSDVQVMYKDGLCTEEGGRAAAQELVDAGASIIVGGVCSSETLGAAPVTEAAGVVLVNGASGSSLIADAGPYTFRTIYSNAEQARVIAGRMVKEGHTQVAIIAEDNAYPDDLANMITAQLEAQNASVVFRADVTTQSDIDAAVAQLPELSADAVMIIPQTAPFSVVLADAVATAELADVAMYTGEVGIFPEALSATSNLEGYIAVIDDFPGRETPGYQDFVGESQCAIGAMCVGSYDTVRLVADVVNSCEEKTSECFKTELEQLQGWTGSFIAPVTFDERGEVIVEPGHEPLYQIVDGVPVPLN